MKVRPTSLTYDDNRKIINELENNKNIMNEIRKNIYFCNYLSNLYNLDKEDSTTHRYNKLYNDVINVGEYKI